MEIQNVTIEDAEELLDIYAPYVKYTAITFEYDVRFCRRIQTKNCEYFRQISIYQGS